MICKNKFVNILSNKITFLLIIKCLLCKLSKCNSKTFRRHIQSVISFAPISRIHACMCHACIALNMYVSIQGTCMPQKSTCMSI